MSEPEPPRSIDRLGEVAEIAGIDRLGEVAEIAWKALLAADRAFQAARETGSAGLRQTALFVLQRASRDFYRAMEAYAEAQDE